MPVDTPVDAATALLHWYDANARALPWRIPPGSGAEPDPYRVWLSEIMLQQTSVAAAAPYFERFVARWPDVGSLAAADDAELMTAWAGLGYYARARGLIACARVVAHELGGRFPDTEVELRKLPGIGAYTAAAIAAIAFGRRAVVVDANVARVVARLFAVETPLPRAGGAIRAHTDTITPDARAGDFAQGIMDLGSGLCTPRRPRCLLCPLRDGCAGFATGTPERFPIKAKKAERPLRFGTVFWVTSPPVRREPVEAHGAGAPTGPGLTGGGVLLVRRPPRGLLGGMRALPTGPWEDAPPGLAGAPLAADWRMLAGTVEHGFTHFRLQLALAVAAAPAHADGHVHADREWWPVDDLGSAGLPTLFARAGEAVRKETG